MYPQMELANKNSHQPLLKNARTENAAC